MHNITGPQAPGSHEGDTMPPNLIMHSDPVTLLWQCAFARCHVIVLQSPRACLEVFFWNLSFEAASAIHVLLFIPGYFQAYDSACRGDDVHARNESCSKPFGSQQPEQMMPAASNACLHANQVLRQNKPGGLRDSHTPTRLAAGCSRATYLKGLGQSARVPDVY